MGCEISRCVDISFGVIKTGFIVGKDAGDRPIKTVMDI